MRGLFGALLALAATALLAAPASAHHSQAMFDTTREVLFDGTVVRFDWVNPHMYLIIQTNGPDGKPMRVEGEGLATTQARADGLNRDALKPGMRVIMRANPNRGGPGKQVRVLDVTTPNGEIHPFYAASTRVRTLKPANSLAGRWAPSRQALGAAFGAMAGWPVTLTALVVTPLLSTGRRSRYQTALLARVERRTSRKPPLNVRRRFSCDQKSAKSLG